MLKNRTRLYKKRNALNRKLLLLCIAGTCIPYQVQKEPGTERSDAGIRLSALLYDLRITPRTEDSLTGKTGISFQPHSAKEICGRLRKLFPDLEGSD